MMDASRYKDFLLFARLAGRRVQHCPGDAGLSSTRAWNFPT
jgi:hypothetical protein